MRIREGDCFPEDIAEAEAEIVSGPLIEYSGAALALFRLMKNMLLFVLPFFVMILFMGGWRFDGANAVEGGVHAVNGALKYLGSSGSVTTIANA